jgi:hypothetical protein
MRSVEILDAVEQKVICSIVSLYRHMKIEGQYMHGVLKPCV